MKKWTAVQYDVSKKLAEVPTKRVKIPAGITLLLIIELEDDLYKRLIKDPVWIHRVQERANAKALPVIEALKTKVKDADAKAEKFDTKTAAIFSNDLNAFLKQKMDAAGAEMAKDVDKFFEEYKKGQTDLLKFRIKSGAKITLNGISIVGAVAVSAASHGALAPAGIVAIARSGVVIAQECAKLATTADQIAKLIQGELKILQAILIKDMANASTKQKVAQGTKEAALGVVSGLLGVETPSLKNCKSHIEVHKVDIAKLDKQSHELGKTIPHAMDEEEKWRKKFDDAKKSLPADKVGKIVQKKEQAEKALHQMLEATFKVGKAVNRANERQELFEKTLAAMEKGVPEWVGYFQTATTLAVDIGLAIGSASSLLDGALSVLSAAEVDITSELVDRV